MILMNSVRHKGWDIDTCVICTTNDLYTRTLHNWDRADRYAELIFVLLSTRFEYYDKLVA